MFFNNLKIKKKGGVVMNNSVLFISPRKTSHIAQGKSVQKIRADISVPAFTILGALEEAGFKTYFIDAVADDLSEHTELINKNIIAKGIPDKKIVKMIKNIQPKFILITSLFTFEQHIIDSLIAAIKKELDICVIVGGTHASEKPEWFFEKNISPDIIVIGDGEETIVELINELNSSKPNLSYINGIVYRDNQGNIKRTKPKNRLTDLAKPWAYKTVLVKPDESMRYKNSQGKKHPLYSAKLSDDKAMNFTLYGSRGCVGNCKYCTTSRKYHQKIAHVGANFMYQQVLKMRNEYNICVFTNEADAFGTNNEDIKFLKMVQRYRHLKNDYAFVLNNPNAFYLRTFFTKNGRLNTNFLDLLIGAGFNIITLAIETFTQRFNDKINWKSINIEQIIELCQEIKSRGIAIEIYMMCCFPGQIHSEFAKDLKMAEKLFPIVNNISWNWLSLLPGTVYYKQYIKNTGKEQLYKKAILNGYGWYDAVPELHLTKISIEYFRNALAPYGQSWK